MMGLPIFLGYLAATAVSLALVAEWDRAGTSGRLVVLAFLLFWPAVAILLFLVRSAANLTVRARAAERAFAEARIPTETIRPFVARAARATQIGLPVAAVTCVAVAVQVVLLPNGLDLMVVTFMMVLGPVVWLNTSGDGRMAAVVFLLASPPAAAGAGLAVGLTRAVGLVAAAWALPIALHALARRMAAAEDTALADTERELLAIENGQDLRLVFVSV
jgi:hypothetical protein